MKALHHDELVPYETCARAASAIANAFFARFLAPRPLPASAAPP